MKFIDTTDDGEFDATLDRLGLIYARNEDGTPYWSPNLSVRLRRSEVDAVMNAAEAVYALMLRTLDHRLTDPAFLPGLGYADDVASRITESRRCGERSLHGRFDFGIRSDGEVRLFEYNCDPLSMHAESSLVQDAWFHEMKRLRRIPQRATQCAGLRAALTAAMRRLPREAPLHILYMHANFGRVCNARILYDAARAAGLDARLTDIEGVRIDGDGRLCSDLGEPLAQAMNFVAWSWIDRLCAGCSTRPTWYDPEWTRVLGHKAFLCDLWREAPDCPFLLPTIRANASVPAGRKTRYVAKPSLGIQGRLVHVVDPGERLPSGDHDWILQDYFDASVDGHFVTVSVWMVDGRPVRSLAIRGATRPVIGEDCNFFPHHVVG